MYLFSCHFSNRSLSPPPRADQISGLLFTLTQQEININLVTWILIRHYRNPICSLRTPTRIYSQVSATTHAPSGSVTSGWWYKQLQWTQPTNRFAVDQIECDKQCIQHVLKLCRSKYHSNLTRLPQHPLAKFVGNISTATLICCHGASN